FYLAKLNRDWCFITKTHRPEDHDRLRGKTLVKINSMPWLSEFRFHLKKPCLEVGKVILRMQMRWERKCTSYTQ
ncbi:MAG: hypothetical protein AAGC68_15050, partial [Verrucomicrobiota bacterium]